ncbi:MULTISPECIES: maleylpyruvate isomerase family mycothiol-dependent enzyme [unclassified Streptomyces]|uniref:maleylpyruvate isomerase family mycothiol-dependent enzyme n=1 Tax=unclassified Streptomyces TaxID=2593676 RepID=UPI00036C37BE|nr:MULTISPECIES: maleylpyruvate isomerase family mycothiol-dependent enzyme [unclassified Streptomyces]MYX35989.1 maleylpyruvate isomerase family mycothiol-dependent enzyme [Streptomyces sp. SID8377]
MPPAARKARTYDPARTRAALTAQVGHVVGAARGLTEDRLTAPSGLPGWDVRVLVLHVARQVEAVARVVAAPAPAKADLDLATWVRSAACFAGPPADGTREAATEGADAAARLEEAAQGLAGVLDEAVAPERLVAVPPGAMRSTDFLVTRLFELVVHSDDLARATGVPVPLERQAVAAVVRLLADTLAVAVPGNSVEVRVPPYAAVQCVPGPRHTRGTPPNVVETDPLTWIRLATGRTSWAEALASAAVSASGERADLAPYLPLRG